jgi:Tannase-like family of unknown function (DUF6351)
MFSPSYCTCFSRLGSALTLAVAAAIAAPAAFSADRHGLQITTLSTKTDLVSGGDVLVRVDVPRGVRPQRVKVELNGRDVSNVFRVDAGGDSLTGLVTGLRLGRNSLEASAGRGNSERLTITNHPITGPIFSGPQQQPFVCETQSFTLPVTGGNLGPPLDANCSTTTRIDYIYKSTDGTLKPLPDPMVRPADLAQTTTTRGNTVPYIVRIETGTINRAIYQISMLHDPVNEPTPDRFRRPAGWNERLVYQFGGGCAAGYHQSRTTGNVLQTPSGGDILQHGYAMASSSLNVFGNNCDDVISAETMIMVREHFIERYGVPVNTIGSGSSGGSMQLHLIANNYPGVMDGIHPRSSFSDTLTFSTPYMDCGLLDRAFNTSPIIWTTEQKEAVVGHHYTWCSTNTTWWMRFIHPRAVCDASIPTTLLYDPVSNPGGARCSLADNMVNVYGYDPATGFGRRPYDNTGIQYGLAALNAGSISVDQFLDLNERIGGYDIDGNNVPERMDANRQALNIAYRTGRINNAAEGLASIPIIDYRAYMDDIGDVHDSGRSHVTRARLIAANGHADNHVILVSSRLGTGAGALARIEEGVTLLMDEWLQNIANDHSRGSKIEKVVRSKPSDLVDACFTTTGEKITDLATCRQMYPPQRNPRLIAGEPLTNDVLKCRLRPVSRFAYGQALSDAQFARLRAIFPDGACDYTRAGMGQGSVKDTWLAYPRPGQSVRLDPDDDGDDRRRGR